jgi:hypothetical protein
MMSTRKQSLLAELQGVPADRMNRLGLHTESDCPC